MKRVAYVTSAEWPISFMLWHHEFVNELAKHVEVDFYVHGGQNQKIDLESNVYLINYALSATQPRENLQNILPLLPMEQMSTESLCYFFNNIEQENYDYIIANEKTSLVLVNEAKISNAKVIYWPTELYTIDNSLYKERTKKLIEYEKEHLNAIDLILFADKNREDAYYEILNSRLRIKKTYFPISSKMVYPEDTQSFHELLNIPKHKKIVLYNGMISEGRYLTQIVDSLQTLDDDCCLVISGPYFGNLEYVSYLKSIDKNEKVYIFHELVDASTRVKLFLSADIGLAFYDNNTLNNELTVKSSDKIAVYLSAGLPIVTFDYKNYSNFFQEFRCGVGIENFEDLKEALNIIFDSYDMYQTAAKIAYSKYYCLENNVLSLYEEMQSL